MNQLQYIRLLLVRFNPMTKLISRYLELCLKSGCYFHPERDLRSRWNMQQRPNYNTGNTMSELGENRHDAIVCTWKEGFNDML
jgi:hypothetical protein